MRQASVRGVRRAAISTMVLVLMLAWSGTVAAEPRSLVVLDFGIIDTTLGETSYHPYDEADARRLTMAADVLREALADHSQYRLVDHGRLDSAVGKATGDRRHLHRCATCQMAVAETLDAEVIMAGSVRKISNLILVMSLELRDVASGERLGGGQVSIRGNVDESWRRGAMSLLKHHLELIDE